MMRNRVIGIMEQNQMLNDLKVKFLVVPVLAVIGFALLVSLLF